ncbi:transposase [Streptomyces sp. NPDC086010]|uniref:transposase n=1 Tax=Streptomyces sp. NPDC086010 TaxID=3365745 RepID=UPI0037D83445
MILVENPSTRSFVVAQERPTRVQHHQVEKGSVYVITDLTSQEASPQRLANINRSQRIIENRLHFVRDTTFAEDASKVRTGHAPDNMATLRSFAIHRLRAGHTNIAADSARCPTTPSAARWTSLASPDQHRLMAIQTLKLPWS